MARYIVQEIRRYEVEADSGDGATAHVANDADRDRHCLYETERSTLMVWLAGPDDGRTDG